MDFLSARSEQPLKHCNQLNFTIDCEIVTLEKCHCNRMGLYRVTLTGVTVTDGACNSVSLCFWLTFCLSTILRRLAIVAGCDPSDHSSFSEVERHLERNLGEKTAGPLDR